MGKFPKDIMADAERVYDRLGRGANQDVEAIAAALLAEREACGKFATDQAEREPYGHSKATAYLIADNIMGAARNV